MSIHCCDTLYNGGDDLVDNVLNTLYNTPFLSDNTHDYTMLDSVTMYKFMVFK